MGCNEMGCNMGTFPWRACELVVFCYTTQVFMSEQKRYKRAWWVEPLTIFLKLSSWIVFPLIIALLAGRVVDQYFSIEPFGTLCCVTLSFFLSLIVLFRETRKVLRELKVKAHTSTQKREEGK